MRIRRVTALLAGICAITLHGEPEAQSGAASESDPCAQLRDGPKQVFNVYLPRHDRDVQIYLPTKWRDEVMNYDTFIGLPVNPEDFSLVYLSQHTSVDFRKIILVSFRAHRHLDAIPDYEIDRSEQFFTEGPFGLYRTEGIVEEEPYIEYRDESTEDSAMTIACRRWVSERLFPCEMTIPGNEIDIAIMFSHRELPNWRLHRDRAISFFDCTMKAAK